MFQRIHPPRSCSWSNDYGTSKGKILRGKDRIRQKMFASCWNCRSGMASCWKIGIYYYNKDILFLYSTKIFN